MNFFLLSSSLTFRQKCPYQWIIQRVSFSKQRFSRFLRILFRAYTLYCTTLFSLKQRFWLLWFVKLSPSFLIPNSICKSSFLFLYCAKPINGYLSSKLNFLFIYSVRNSVSIKNRKFTLLKSAHVHKEARAQLELRSYYENLHLYIRSVFGIRFLNYTTMFFQEHAPYNLALRFQRRYSRYYIPRL